MSVEYACIILKNLLQSMPQNKKEYLKPKYDIVFQVLFGKNKQNITQSFISDILGKPIEIIDIKIDDTIMKDYPNDKAERLDLKTKFKDGTICQIEMQLTDDFELRIIELSKAEKALQKDKSNRLAQWLSFLDNPYTERVEEIMKKTKK